MKKIFLKNSSLLFILAFLFLLSCTSKDRIEQISSVINIPDSHFEMILIEQGIDSDATVNHQILKEDIENITRLDLNLSANSGQIEDLTGIEGFTNLTFLSAANQELKYLDLSTNTQLDSLYIHGNYLTEMDLSKNIHLTLVNIESNELHTINGLEYATNLKKLVLSWNNFKNFRLNNDSVEVFYISHNLLKTLELNDAPNLTNVFAIINEVSSIELVNNLKLETLVLSGNFIENINLEYNTYLTHFYASSNKLSSLDVSANQKLEDLRIDRNPSLTCIQKGVNQNIPTVNLSSYQNISNDCNSY